MAEFFDICGTHIPLSSIKDFRIIEVEFIFRPVFHETKKSMINTLTGKKFEFVAMQPYAAIVGQQGQKSLLGEYKPKNIKESLGKDLGDAIAYTIADKLRIKAIKQHKYHCKNLAGREFTTYLDDVPVMLTWNNGRMAEVFKEDSLYSDLGENTTPSIQSIPALRIQANETFCFYGNGIQISDASFEFERLKNEIDQYHLSKTSVKQIGTKEKLALPPIPKIHIPTKLLRHKDSSSTNTTEELDNI